MGKLAKAFFRIGFYLFLILFGVLLGLVIQGIWSDIFSGKITTGGVPILESVQAMSHLTTTRYNFSNIVTSEREMPSVLGILYGERLVMVAVGHVVAGIDLKLLTPEDVSRSSGRLSLRLPPPGLQDCFLNESASYVISRDTGIFARPLPSLDTESRRFALRQFRDMALEQGILNDVQTQSQNALREFIASLNIPGVTQVQITTQNPDPNAPLPESCR